MQARDASVAMLIATVSAFGAVAVLAEGQAGSRLVSGSGKSTCVSVSKAAANSIRASRPKSPVAAGESAVGCVLHGCRWKDTSC